MSQIEGQWTRQDYRREVERLLAENQRLRDLAEAVRIYVAEPTLENEHLLAAANAALAAVRVEDER